MKSNFAVFLSDIPVQRVVSHPSVLKNNDVGSVHIVVISSPELKFVVLLALIEHNCLFSGDYDLSKKSLKFVTVRRFF